jgi:hypothetical protein
LAAQHADLDLNHVQPASVLANVMELQSAQHASRFCGGEGLVQRTGRVCRQIVEHDAVALERAIGLIRGRHDWLVVTGAVEVIDRVSPHVRTPPPPTSSSAWCQYWKSTGACTYRL